MKTRQNFQIACAAVKPSDNIVPAASKLKTVKGGILTVLAEVFSEERRGAAEAETFSEQ